MLPKGKKILDSMQVLLVSICCTLALHVKISDVLQIKHLGGIATVSTLLYMLNGCD